MTQFEGNSSNSQWIECHDLFVATDLLVLLVPKTMKINQDLVVSKKRFRKMDAQYWLWIEGRMKRSRKASISGAASSETEKRFAIIQTWVEQTFDLEGIERLRMVFNEKTYRPPFSGLKYQPQMVS